jgi:hypothetical protein
MPRSTIGACYQVYQFLAEGDPLEIFDRRSRRKREREGRKRRRERENWSLLSFGG